MITSDRLVYELNCVQKGSATILYNGEPLVLGIVSFNPGDNTIELNHVEPVQEEELFDQIDADLEEENTSNPDIVPTL